MEISRSPPVRWEEPGALVTAFCRRLGLPEKTVTEVGRSSSLRNESMSMLATLLVSSLNQQRPRLIGGKFNPKRAENDVRVLSRIKGEKFRLPPEVEMKIRRESQADVEWLNATFGTQLYLDVFSDQQPHVVSGEGAYSPEMLQSLSLLLSDLINRQGMTAERLSRRVLSLWQARGTNAS